MSTDIYLVCDDSKEYIHIAQLGMSGFSFYSGEKDCMRALKDWLEGYMFSEGWHDKRLRISTEHYDDLDGYKEIVWTPNHLLSSPQPGIA